MPEQFILNELKNELKNEWMNEWIELNWIGERGGDRASELASKQISSAHGTYGYNRL